MNITAEQLSTCTGCTLKRAKSCLYYINKAMSEFDIDSPCRVAMFLAELANESENLSNLTDIFGNPPSYKIVDGEISSTYFLEVFKAESGLSCLGLDSCQILLAAWYWDHESLNEDADQGDLTRCSSFFPNGLKRLKDVRNRYTLNCNVLGVKMEIK